MKQNLTLGASVLAAIAASLCCTGPLAMLALGLGSFGLANFIESGRPYFLVATFGLLAVAFYLTYRKRSMICADGTCRIITGSRWNKLMLWIATVVVILFTTFPYYSETLVATLNGDSDQSTRASAMVTDVANFSLVQQRFEHDSGKVRLITLLSPT